MNAPGALPEPAVLPRPLSPDAIEGVDGLSIGGAVVQGIPS